MGRERGFHHRVALAHPGPARPARPEARPELGPVGERCGQSTASCRKGLTNAAKHAPGAAVDVHVVRVRGPELARLAAALAGHELHWESATELLVSGLSVEQVGDLAYQTGRDCTSCGPSKRPWSRPIWN